MPRLNILSKLEQKEFNSPPILSTTARKSIFRLNQTTTKYLRHLENNESKINFVLMYNYFKITKKFFTPQLFLYKI